MLNHDEIVDRIGGWDFSEEIDTSVQGSPGVSDIYTQLQSYFTNYFLHFDNVRRISKQYSLVIQDLLKESSRIGQIAGFIKDGTKRQTGELDKSMTLLRVFSDRMNAIHEDSKTIISLAYDMEKSNHVVKDSVDELVVNQDKNDQAIQNMFGVMQNLVLKTQRIGRITEMMKKVSSETFLLGINAKVEAVRAGASGKGFSVVAEEIQRLSEESKSAAENINETIDSFSDEIGLLEKVAQESQALFAVQKDTINEVDGMFRKNSEDINTFIAEQESFSTSITEIKEQEAVLAGTILNIIKSVKEISSTANEISISLVDLNNSISYVKKLDKDMAADMDALNRESQMISVKKPEIRKRKIAFLFDIDHPFYYPTKAEAVKAAGIYNYDVSFFAPQSRGEATKEQAAQLDRVLQEKYDALVISPINDELIIQKLKQAVKAGIKVIFLNSKLDGIEHVSLILTDGFTIGHAAAHIVMGALGNEGEAIVNTWTGMKLDAIENRKDGFMQELKRSSRITVHEYPVKSNPTPEEAEAIIRGMLQSCPNARFIYMTNMEWGMFAANYLRKHHADIQVITVDFSDEVSKAIQDGLIHYSLGQRAYLWGSTAVVLFDNVFNRLKVSDRVDTGVFEVNASNVSIHSSLE